MTPDDLVSAACKAAEEGMFVFPVLVSPSKDRPGKHDKTPLCEWRRLSTDDPEQVVRLNWGGATHFGIDCEKSRIWVVDVDDRSALARCPLKQTRMQETISGGMHFIYRPADFDQRNTTNNPTTGIDIRANGGFIVWYGEGEMADDSINPWPWAHPIMKDTPRKQAKDAWEPGPVRAGGRNSDLISACGAFMHRNPGATMDIVAAYAVGHSVLYHSPVLSREECIKVADSAMRWQREDATENDLGYYGAFSGLPRKEPPAKICGDWLRAGSYSLCYARAGLGKTAFIAELIWCLKNKQQFFGMECYDPGDILWINGDLPDWQIHERLGFLDGKATLWHMEQANMFPHVDLLLDRCARYKLVIFDNRPALFYLNDANKAEDWHPLNTLMRQICSEGSAVILMGHEGKGEGGSSFGSSAQEWVADNIIRIRDPIQKELEPFRHCHKMPSRVVTWTKSRLCAPPDKRLFYFTENLLERRLLCEWGAFLK
jgi:hypothetical protein